MSVKYFEEILKDIDYRNWTFDVRKDGNRAYLQVRFLALDVVNGGVKYEVGRKWFLSDHMTRSEVVQTALKAVLTAEEHEVRENFLYNGKRIFGPHIDVDALWEACDRTDFREEPV